MDFHMSCDMVGPLQSQQIRFHENLCRNPHIAVSLSPQSKDQKYCDRRQLVAKHNKNEVEIGENKNFVVLLREIKLSVPQFSVLHPLSSAR